MRELRRALSLLTILPVRADWEDPTPLGRSMVWYPCVGAALGLVLMLAALALHAAPELLRAALLVALWAVLTGGLHLDGWADCCDGLLAAAEPARRLEILKDSRVGGFGATGLVLLLLVKTAALAALSARPDGLLLAATLARCVVVPVAAWWPAARAGGMGERFRAGLGPLPLLVALFALVFVGSDCPAAVVAALVTAWGLAHFAAGRLGGLTGDVYGAVIEAAETAVLVTVALAR